jgi:hypothetical protein
MKKKLLLASLILTSIIAFAAPKDYWEITYYQSAAKVNAIGSTPMMCGRVFHEGQSSKHFTKDIIGSCSNNNQLD